MQSPSSRGCRNHEGPGKPLLEASGRFPDGSRTPGCSKQGFNITRSVAETDRPRMD